MLHKLVVLYLAAFSQAYTTFDTTCSTPSTVVNYVSSADTRSTTDILWSCLFTIIACTWTVQHLNVPEQRERRNPGWLGNVKWGLKNCWTSTKWMLITVIAPEVLLGKYLADVVNAHNDLKKMKDFAAQDEVPWTLAHCLFANMGGFVLRRHAVGRIGKQRNIGCQSIDIPGSPEQRVTIQESLGAGNSVSSRDTVPYDEEGSDPPKVAGSTKYPNPYHLLASDIFALREAGVISRLPYISPEELQDRSKSDSLIRIITILQIVWMIIQILARAVRHLAISQLEIAVIAFASCAIVMYGLNWYKPKGVQVPITILQYRGEAPKQVFDVLFLAPSAVVYVAPFTDWIRTLRRLFGLPSKPLGAPIPNDYSRDEYGGVIGLAFGGLLFGGIHLAAWKFDFPSRIEQVLWWSASLWCTCSIFAVPIFTLAVGSLFTAIDDLDKYVDFEKVLDSGLVLLILSYGLARLYLIVEVFRTLCFLPPDAYISTFAINIPHVS